MYIPNINIQYHTSTYVLRTFGAKKKKIGNGYENMAF